MELFLYFEDKFLIGHFANIFSHSVGCLSFCLWFPLLCKSFLSLISCLSLSLFFFFLFLLLWEVNQRKILLRSVSESVLAIFSSKSSVASGLTIRSLFHLDLFLCMVLKGVLISFFINTWSCSVFQEPCVEECLFSILCPCLLCHR